MNIPRIMIAAAGSGSGKTLLSCALMMLFSQEGKSVSAIKCGPDYIDPMFHRTVLGVPSRNLDTFFTGERLTKSLFARAADDRMSFSSRGKRGKSALRTCQECAKKPLRNILRPFCRHEIVHPRGFDTGGDEQFT